jgi:hypothetical protein
MDDTQLARFSVILCEHCRTKDFCGRVLGRLTAFLKLPRAADLITGIITLDFFYELPGEMNSGFLTQLAIARPGLREGVVARLEETGQQRNEETGELIESDADSEGNLKGFIAADDSIDEDSKAESQFSDEEEAEEEEEEWMGGWPMNQQELPRKLSLQQNNGKETKNDFTKRSTNRRALESDDEDDAHERSNETKTNTMLRDGTTQKDRHEGDNQKDKRKSSKHEKRKKKKEHENNEEKVKKEVKIPKKNKAEIAQQSQGSEKAKDTYAKERKYQPNEAVQQETETGLNSALFNQKRSRSKEERPERQKSKEREGEDELESLFAISPEKKVDSEKIVKRRRLSKGINLQRKE